MKNRVFSEHYYQPGNLERQISVFVEHYNNQRYCEILNNFTRADVYFGGDMAILKRRNGPDATDHPATPLATFRTSSIISLTNEADPSMLKPL